MIFGSETFSNFSGAGDLVTDALNDWSLLYRADVQQGNVITQEMMDKVQIGMDKRQVRYALGTPVLVDVFHQERWDYLYWLKIPGEETVLKTLTLYFDNGYLDRITGDYEPEQSINEEEKRVVVDVPEIARRNDGARVLRLAQVAEHGLVFDENFTVRADAHVDAVERLAGAPGACGTGAVECYDGGAFREPVALEGGDAGRCRIA